MHLISPIQQKRIVNNIVAACDDIEKLNKQGYDFLNLCSGFIAHYNLNGFKSYYSDASLEQDIVFNAKANQWKNFTPGDQYYDYMMQKRETYNMILGALAAKEYKQRFYN